MFHGWCVSQLFVTVTKYLGKLLYKEKMFKSGVVAQVYNASYLGGRDGRREESWFEAIQSQKFVRPHLNKWLCTVLYTSHPNYNGKHKLEDRGPCHPGHNVRPYLNHNQCKTSHRVAQVRKCLCRKNKILSSTQILQKIKLK
jgi:hypothetical protein